MGRKVIISRSGESDLSDIVAYVARHNQDAAVKLGNALVARIVEGHEEIQVARLRIERAFRNGTKQVEAPHFETATQDDQRGPVLFDQCYHTPSPTRSRKLLQVDWPFPCPHANHLMQPLSGLT
jgi:hypothetical protein